MGHRVKKRFFSAMDARYEATLCITMWRILVVCPVLAKMVGATSSEGCLIVHLCSLTQVWYSSI